MTPMRDVREMIEREDWTAEEEAAAVEEGRAAYREDRAAGLPLQAYLQQRYKLSMRQFNRLPKEERVRIIALWASSANVTTGRQLITGKDLRTPWLSTPGEMRHYDRKAARRTDRIMTICAYGVMLLTVVGLIIALALAAPGFWTGGKGQ